MSRKAIQYSVTSNVPGLSSEMIFNRTQIAQIFYNFIKNEKDVSVTVGDKTVVFKKIEPNTDKGIKNNGY